MTLFELIEKSLKRKGGAEKLFTGKMLRQLVYVSMNGMFEYEGLPESIRPEFLEQFLHQDGTAVLWQHEGQWIASTGDYASTPDVYGLGEEVRAVTLNGITASLKPDKDCVVMWNNSHMLSDAPVIEFAVDYLTELFTSLKSNIIYSRLKPIFRADNDAVKAAVENAFKQVSDNEPIVVSSDNVLAKMIEGTGNWQDLNVLNITDPENSTKLQYLVKCIDDVLRWLYGLYGQAIQGNGKLAQQTVDEVNGDTSISFILPNNMLKQRQKALEKFNQLAGTNATVDFSIAWKTEETKYIAQADKTEAEADKLEAEADQAENPEEAPEEVTPEERTEDNEEVV